MNDFEKLLSDALRNDAAKTPDVVRAPDGLAVSVRRRRARKISVLAAGAAGIVGLMSVAGMARGPDDGKKDVFAAPTTSAPETGDLAIPKEPSATEPPTAAVGAPTTNEPSPDAPGSTSPPTDPPADSAPAPWGDVSAQKAPPKDWPTPIPPGGFSYPRIDDVGAQAAGLRQLVEVDHTFGPGHRWDTVYIHDYYTYSDMLIPFTDSEKALLEAAIADLTPVVWIWSANDVPGLTSEGPPSGTTVVRIGAAVEGPQGPQITMSHYCGNVCAYGVTYTLANGPGGWTVTGTTGPATIS